MAAELKERVQELINNEINPGVADHGGYVHLVDVKDNIVYVQLAGGCHGCSSASFTLKEGIERMIIDGIPEIKEVVDVTDHSGAMNPFC